jgi:hypothetical protein
MDIKKDFSAWDFVKQKPKYTNPYGNIIEGSVTSHVMGVNNITTTDVDTTFFVNNMEVTGSALIPPQEGQMKYDTVTQTMATFHNGEWVNISGPERTRPIWDVEYPTNRKSLLTRFKDWLKNVVS